MKPTLIHEESSPWGEPVVWFCDACRWQQAAYAPQMPRRWVKVEASGRTRYLCPRCARERKP